MDGPTTPAVGGGRSVPVPDPVARDYLLLGLRLDQQVPGLVDGYYGPADLKAQVDLEPLTSPARLQDDAAALRDRLAEQVEDAGRRAWLEAQLVALETQAGALAGGPLPYLEHVTRCFSWTPVRRAEAVFDAAAAEIEAILPADLAPGAGLAERLDVWDRQFVVAPAVLPSVVDWLVGRFRARADALFGLPAGEALDVSFVRGQPWSGYCWYDGGLRSRIDLNLDLPIRARDLVHTIAHETYPGHHTEHSWKDHDEVVGAGHLEASILLINTPECLISEGLADAGVAFVAPPEEEVGLLVELYERAGLDVSAAPSAARDAAERTAAMAGPRRRLQESRVNAALLLHADGATRTETVAYLHDRGRFPMAVAEKRLEFIEHPLWRTYVFVYYEGEALLRRWLAAVPAADRPARFARLLHEPLTPGGIAAELDQAAPAEPATGT